MMEEEGNITTNENIASSINEVLAQLQITNERLGAIEKRLSALEEAKNDQSSTNTDKEDNITAVLTVNVLYNNVPVELPHRATYKDLSEKLGLDDDRELYTNHRSKKDGSYSMSVISLSSSIPSTLFPANWNNYVSIGAPVFSLETIIVNVVGGLRSRGEVKLFHGATYMDLLHELKMGVDTKLYINEDPSLRAGAPPEQSYPVSEQSYPVSNVDSTICLSLYDANWYKYISIGKPDFPW